MADNTTDDLAQIQHRIHEALETELAQTLGQVKALQRVTQEITATEQDIRRHQAIAAQIEAELRGSSSKSLQKELEGEKVRLERLERIRSALISDLSDLANALGPS